MSDTITLTISILALCVSGLTLWLTWLRRGTVKMTRPTTLFLGPDARDSAKVYLRALLYSTSARGRMIENAYVTLTGKGATTSFSIWVLGEKELSRGSGLYVGPQGVAYNHHFLLSKQSTPFAFSAGDFTLRMYVTLVGSRAPHLLSEIPLRISSEDADLLASDRTAGIYFDWDPGQITYLASIDRRPSPMDFYLSPR